MSAPPILFKTKKHHVELTGHNLPKPPIQWGGKQRNTITRYSDDWVTVQSHGVELQEIEINGLLKDDYLGEGGAQKYRSALEAIMFSRLIVAFEYDKDQLWGTFDVSFHEERRDKIEYTVKFTPLWQYDPMDAPPVTFEDPPLTSSVKLDQIRAALAKLINKPPAGVNHHTAPIVGVNPPAPAVATTNDSSSALNELLRLQGSADLALMHFTNELSKVRKIAGLPFMTLQSLYDLSLRAASLLNTQARFLNQLNADLISHHSIVKVNAGLWILEIQKTQRTLRYQNFLILQRLSSQIRPFIIRKYIVKEGDTLIRIAGETLGDFSRWFEIADANNLIDTTLIPGQILNIPRVS